MAVAGIPKTIDNDIAVSPFFFPFPCLLVECCRGVEMRSVGGREIGKRMKGNGRKCMKNERKMKENERK